MTQPQTSLTLPPSGAAKLRRMPARHRVTGGLLIDRLVSLDVDIPR
jgi:hypothetical protein